MHEAGRGKSKTPNLYPRDDSHKCQVYSLTVVSTLLAYILMFYTRYTHGSTQKQYVVRFQSTGHSVKARQQTKYCIR